MDVLRYKAANMSATFDTNNWSIASCNALLAGGVNVHLSKAVYDIGSADRAIVLESTAANLTMDQGTILDYSGGGSTSLELLDASYKTLGIHAKALIDTKTFLNK